MLARTHGSAGTESPNARQASRDQEESAQHPTQVQVGTVGDYRELASPSAMRIPMLQRSRRRKRYLARGGRYVSVGRGQRPPAARRHVARLWPPAEGPANDRGGAANGPCHRQEAGCGSEPAGAGEEASACTDALQLLAGQPSLAQPEGS